MSFIEFLKYYLYIELLESILVLIILFVFRGRLRAFVNRCIRVTRVHKNQDTPYPEDDFNDYCPECGYHLDYCGCQLDNYEDCDCEDYEDCNREDCNSEDCNREDYSENSYKQTTTPKE